MMDGSVPLPLRTPQIYTMMEYVSNGHKNFGWWCYGDWLVGCYDTYHEKGTTYDHSMICNGDGIYAYQGTDTFAVNGLPLNNYEKECYCKFTDASCQFDYYTCTPTFQNGDPTNIYTSMYDTNL